MKRKVKTKKDPFDAKIEFRCDKNVKAELKRLRIDIAEVCRSALDKEIAMTKSLGLE
jgi:hypothetical protein